MHYWHVPSDKLYHFSWPHLGPALTPNPAPITIPTLIAYSATPTLAPTTNPAPILIPATTTTQFSYPYCASTLAPILTTTSALTPPSAPCPAPTPTQQRSVICQGAPAVLLLVK